MQDNREINESRYSKLWTCLIFILLVMFIINMVSGMLTYSASSRIEKQLDSIVFTYNDDSNQQESRFKDKTGYKPPLNVQTLDELFLNEENKEIAWLISIIESSGLEKLTEFEEFSPEKFQAIMKHNIREKQLEYYRRKAREQLETDKIKYGEKLMLPLYRKFIPITFDKEINGEQIVEYMNKGREAINESISQCPDSYSVARRLCSEIYVLSQFIGYEKYFQESIKAAEKRRDTLKADQILKMWDDWGYELQSQLREDIGVYYSVLKDFEKRNSAILDFNGFKAMPRIELQLAGHYFEAGLIDKSNNMLETLKTDYSNEDLVSYVYYAPGLLSRTPSSVPEAVEKLLSFISDKNESR